MIFGIVDPQIKTNDFVSLVDMFAKENDVPITSGVAVITIRPEPVDEEEIAFQAISPGTHEINFVLDFDPNDEFFVSFLEEDTMCSRYNIANQLCSAITLNALKDLDCTPTYMTIKLCGDYISDETYEKIKSRRL
jgi:hypothetical protein